MNLSVYSSSRPATSTCGVIAWQLLQIQSVGAAASTGSNSPPCPHKVRVTRYKVQVTRYKVQGTRLQGTRYKVQGTRYTVHCTWSLQPSLSQSAELVKVPNSVVSPHRAQVHSSWCSYRIMKFKLLNRMGSLQLAEGQLTSV